MLLNRMTAIIPNEAEAKQRLAESLKKIRRAEGFPVKGQPLSLGKKPKDWIQTVERLRQAAKR